MKKIFSNIIFIIIAIILIYLFFTKILGVPDIFLLSLLGSSILVYFLSKSKNIITIWITALLIIWNILLLLFFLVPTYSKTINLNWFYEKQKNFLKISIEDEQDILKDNNVSIYILNKTQTANRPLIHNLYDPRKDRLEVEILPGDTISFRSKTKNIKSIINLYTWDWTIVRIFPQTTISINKLIKDTQELTKSQTQIQVDQWSIWFNIIKTIVDWEWFKIKTGNWTLVIRWTSWLVWYNWNETQEASNTVVYSQDHIIELEHNNWKSYLISKWDNVQFNNENFIKIDLEKFQRIIGENISQKMNQIPSLDTEDVILYKTKLKTYIISNFGWKLEWKKSLEALWQYKLYILTLINKKYDYNLDNYKKYKILLWEGTDYVKDIKDYSQDMIFTPANQQLNNIKLKYIENKSLVDDWYFKTFIINSWNQVLDAGKSIDIPKLQEYLPYIQQYKDLLKQYVTWLLQQYNINN